MKTLIPLDPQPPYEWIRPVVDKQTGEVHAYCDPDPTGVFCPYLVGSLLNNQRVLSVGVVRGELGWCFEVDTEDVKCRH